MAELGIKLGRRGLVRARLYPILTMGLTPILTGQFSYTYMTLFSIALFFWSITFDLTNYVKVSSWSKVQQSQKSPDATIDPLIVGHFSSNSIFNQNCARNVGQISNLSGCEHNLKQAYGCIQRNWNGSLWQHLYKPILPLDHTNQHARQNTDGASVWIIRPN